MSGDCSKMQMPHSRTHTHNNIVSQQLKCTHKETRIGALFVQRITGATAGKVASLFSCQLPSYAHPIYYDEEICCTHKRNFVFRTQWKLLRSIQQKPRHTVTHQHEFSEFNRFDQILMKYNFHRITNFSRFTHTVIFVFSYQKVHSHFSWTHTHTHTHSDTHRHILLFVCLFCAQTKVKLKAPISSPSEDDAPSEKKQNQTSGPG